MYDSYLSTFYNMLFHPVTAFRTLREDTPSNRMLVYALITVVLISGLGPLIYFVGHGGAINRLFYEVPIQALFGLILWMASSIIISLLAFAFTGEPRIRLLLTLTAFATLPWIFEGPATLLQASAGTLGTVLGGIGSLAVWLWSVVLFGFAVGCTYRLSAERTVIILFAPFMMGLIFISWFTGFVINIMRIWPGTH